MTKALLSADTVARLEVLFAPADREEATQLLVDLCGDNLPFCENSTSTSLERIRFAALKQSCGELSALYAAVELANVDWRDLLVAADFADDPEAHRAWMPTRRSIGN